MLTSDSVAAVVQQISYRSRPSWWLYVGSFEDGRLYLQVRFEALDSETGQSIRHSGRKWGLSGHMTISEVVSTAFMAFKAAEEHEARERFRYKGQRVFGPHLDVDSLAALLADGTLKTSRREEE